MYCLVSCNLVQVISPKGLAHPQTKGKVVRGANGPSEEFGHQTYVCPDARRASLLTRELGSTHSSSQPDPTASAQTPSPALLATSRCGGRACLVPNAPGAPESKPLRWIQSRLRLAGQPIAALLARRIVQALIQSQIWPRRCLRDTISVHELMANEAKRERQSESSTKSVSRC
jgi:hypothetical protein